MNRKINAIKAKQSLKHAVSHAFEVMAFLDVSESSPEERNYENKIQIAISKPFRGSMTFFLTDGLKRRIAENIYGEGSLLSKHSGDDCLLEILNVIAGNFMSSYFGIHACYKMDLPLMIMTQEPPAGFLAESFFNAEGEKFRVALCQLTEEE
jgi:hypothetical protein